jgi:hypothetical protein
MTNDKRGTHGGKREGAGRKGKGYTAVLVKLPPELLDNITNMAEEAGISRNEFIVLHLSKLIQPGR